MSFRKITEEERRAALEGIRRLQNAVRHLLVSAMEDRKSSSKGFDRFDVRHLVEDLNDQILTVAGSVILEEYEEIWDYDDDDAAQKEER